MNLEDFKNWFDGVVFALGDRPTKEQWQQIKDKFALATKDISGEMVRLPMVSTVPTFNLSPVPSNPSDMQKIT